MPSLPHPPVTAAEIPEEWTDMVRGMIAKQHHHVRARQTSLAIEVESLTTCVWHPIMLPGGGTLFTTAAERDAVLALLLAPPPGDEKTPASR